MRVLFAALLLFLYEIATAQPRFTDSTLGTNGKVVENTSVPPSSLADIVLQTDGKTIAVTQSSYNGLARIVLNRRNIDGSPDNTFSGDGIADSLITPGLSCYPEAISLQTDGKIVVCGFVDGNQAQAFVFRFNTNGSLDASFGNGGIFYLPASSNGTINDVYDLVILPDGKLMLLSTLNYPGKGMALTRLTANGVVDNSFGTNGTVTINPLSTVQGYNNQYYNRIEMQADGKFIIAGNPDLYLGYSNFNFILVRINANGTIDYSYGTNGYLLLLVGPKYDVLSDIAMQPDGKIVACGEEEASGFRVYTYVVRVTTSGTLDTTFGNGGKQFLYYRTTGFAPTRPQVSLQADGKILVGGIAKNAADNYTMAVARLTTTGIPDATFDGDGIALLPVNGYDSYGYIPLQQADGKVLIAGFARTGNRYVPAIGRLTTAGQPDATLNIVATAIVSGNGAGTEEGANVYIQPADQKIVSIRKRSNGFENEICVSRHLLNGQPDGSFGTGGNTFIELPGYYSDLHSGLSADGKITVVPTFNDYTIYSSLAVVRLQANGNPDSSFGINGKKIFKTNPFDTTANYLIDAVIQPDGKTLLLMQQTAGQPNYNPARDSAFIIRLGTNGSYDNSFGTNGKKFIPNGQNIDALALQPDGKIILAVIRLSASGTSHSTYISRLNPDGSTDATFNSGVEKEITTQVSHLTLQADGKILLTTGLNTIIRLSGSGIVDSTFGTNGIIDVNGYYDNNAVSVNNIRTDSSRIILMAVPDDSITNEPYMKVVALKYNGQADSTFGQNGIVVAGILAESYNDAGQRVAIQADRKIVITGYTNAVADSTTSFALTRLKSNNLTISHFYTFNGNGLWSSPGNWADGTVPPTTITAGNSLVIDPPATGECIIDITVHVQAGATVTIKAGKKLRLPGNLIIQ